MIDLYYFPTPNGDKISIFLEESTLEYRFIKIDIFKNEQFSPEFLLISPNNKIPAIVDHHPADGGPPISIFESGAILIYLAEKTGRFLSPNFRNRFETLQWLFWQVAGLGPMAGQNHHFTHYAPEKIPYAIERYVKETKRLYTVLEKRLIGREFIIDDYSIADMAIYPWITYHKWQSQNLEDFPNINRWVQCIHNRAAVQRAYAKREQN
ncbi:MAG: glutathione S-transferase N-terminal domain-containing protein [Proteobacteria bacterium]|nr:glutathione S-transferase N-terminal domain-containing protein [Pseudomonadota bacterium]